MTGHYPRYSIQQLEEAATRLLRKHFTSAVSVPVDIDYLLECQPGVSLDFAPGLRSRFGVAGMVLSHPGDQRFTILIDESVGNGLASFYRFTLAEELAHLVLHRSIIAGIRSLQDAVALHSSPVYYSCLDRNAKWMASALLMPAEHLTRHARELFTALCGDGISPDLLRLLTLRLAQKYNVSTSAMKYRLEKWPVKITASVLQAMRAAAGERPAARAKARTLPSKPRSQDDHRGAVGPRARA